VIETRHYATAADSSESRRYLVAYLDVLGFSERVRSTPLDQLLRDYERLLSDIGWSTETPVFTISPARVDYWKTRAVVASDSIMLWSDTTPEASEMLLTSTSRVLGRAAEMGWPLRGVITAGSCIMNEERGLFIGGALVEAVTLERGQEWVGCAIAESALADPSCRNDHSEPCERGLVCRFR
jgi:hypothetical protein